MKLNNIEMLVTKIEVRKNKKEEAFLLVDLLDLQSGDAFQIADKDIELMGKLKPMTKYNLDLNLINTGKYGLRISIVNVGKNLGTV